MTYVRMPVIINQQTEIMINEVWRIGLKYD